MAGSSKQFFKYTVVENVTGNIAQKTYFKIIFNSEKIWVIFDNLKRLLFVVFQNKGGFDNPVWEYWDAKEINNNCNNSQ